MNKPAFKGTVVIISLVHWHFTWQSVHNIAAGLAGRGYRVIFIEPLPKRWPRLNEAGRVWGRLTGHSEAAGMCRQTDIPGVEILTPQALPDVGSMAQSANRRFFVPRLVNDLEAMDLPRPLISINYLPTSASLALQEALNPDVAFYHCVHDWSHDPHTGAAVSERNLLKQVDMVWGDIDYNIERNAPYHDNIVLMRKGVNIDLFSKASAPPPDSEKPLCAFFGTIGVATDIDLLRKVSYEYPLRLIGPSRFPLDGFAPGTEIVGAVAHEQLPELLADVNVLLLPYLQAPHIKGLVPAKIFECMATGKPMVSIGLTTLDEYSDLIAMCDTHEAFLTAIGETVKDTDEKRAERIACAEANSYATRIDEIEGYIDSILVEKELVDLVADQQQV